MNVSEIEAPPATAAEGSCIERRRPGRPSQASPELVPLLRGAASADHELEAERQFGDPDQLRGARGLATAFAVSGALWAGIIYAGRWIFS